MRRVIGTSMLVVILLLGLSSIPASHAQSGDDTVAEYDGSQVEQLVADHVANPRIQSERPDFQPETPDIKPRKPNRILEAIAKFFASIFQMFGGVMKFLLIAVVACALLYAAWYMFWDVTALRWGRKKKPDGPDISVAQRDGPDRGEAKALLEQADALAAEGRYAEAVHLLLFRSIEDVRERRTGGIPQSLTAREIQSLSDLSARARHALFPIIRIVETSFFGGRQVDQAGWQDARASYEQFAFGARAT